MSGNKMKMEFLSKSQNESFARVAVAAFISQLDPTMEEITDVKTAVSEAVTNSIIHGYGDREDGIVKIQCEIFEKDITIIVEDDGIGIEDVKQAMTPLYTSRPDLERSGMGFTVMETFMDELRVESTEKNGTRIIMKKKLKSIE
ncbi:anti-sigma F factor [Clostridium novyi]|uniref:Anti-sigma F factor n=1 Tax=Clostridium novyi (strain NT) TaxID=386415 RepID=SP2AB_CLONN|nr:anti-sigma F factor [Clostridium novyi]A0PZS6.1 RecName: Full=Anti-sigma F factor; AltName: Full=Stage II sporulation protein AB [Clostridium novyi NT]ABK61462.1 anti-sigma F factor [Clostridium novyi NT]KEH88418.1 anti-sigma F factor [Clostridium novyi A str. NCTC 538]